MWCPLKIQIVGHPVCLHDSRCKVDINHIVEYGLGDGIVLISSTPKPEKHGNVVSAGSRRNRIIPTGSCDYTGVCMTLSSAKE